MKTKRAVTAATVEKSATSVRRRGERNIGTSNEES
jgi:hypothetical protein